MNFPNRKFFASVLLMVMVVLATLTGTGYGSQAWLAGSAAWLAGMLLWPMLLASQKKQAIFLAGIGVLAFGVSVLGGQHPIWTTMLTQNIALLGMLGAVSFLQLLKAPNDAIEALPRGRIALWRTALGVHLHAREALEHFRAAAKEQREQDQRQFEQQIQFLQGELRTAKDTVNTKQQELIRSHEDNARLSSELTHAHSELHRQEGEVRSLRSAKEQLAVAEVKNQQLSEQLAQANARVADLGKENQANFCKLQETMETGQRLESELMAAKAVVVSHEKIFEKLTALQVPQPKSVNTKKNSVESQNSLFNSGE
ncbi:hypothetical protein OYT13_10980 [Pandoraea sp. XJJ-1]|uniref:hypothetical protein n=1 Tax=Pandoraea sp. XJJ-1 TaxID=3002643 RepID=UPI0022807A42|nr:hypothetical protein [Pandoraea sp. XJJ-1]WAL84888.1 hypothetical protein OYT13_10980 [Pandoraea sp. XJJ-1]